MNFYDEEIQINAPSASNLDKVRVESIDQMNAHFKKQVEDEPTSLQNSKVAERINIDSLGSPNKMGIFGQHPPVPIGKIGKLSDTDSDEDKESLESDLLHVKSNAEATECKPSIDVKKIESLQLDADIEDIFRHVLKYTPQHSQLPYQLSPFIPDFVPSIGDVDALLKVSVPDLLKQSRPIAEHLAILGLHVLDEPSGTQSDPSLLNIKLNTFSSASAAGALGILTPMARNNKDIDTWIGEVEQMNVMRSMHHVHLTKNIEAIALQWPEEFLDSALIDQARDALKNHNQGSLTLLEYIQKLCILLKFENNTQLTSDSVYIHNIYTIFCIYLVTYNAWH